ncbi:MAG: helix-turn-helix domain-containing protein [Gemmataceae bacterium]
MAKNDKWIFWRVPEVAQTLRVSQGTVRRLIRNGCLPAKKFGRLFMIQDDHLKELVRTTDYSPVQKEI